MNRADFALCATDADCSVEGFCYGGTCTPLPITGHCEYSSSLSAGFCQGLGSCVGELPCDTSTAVGCCENDASYPAYGCPTLCASGIPADCVGVVGCNAVPSGADCPFCEGCDAWPLVGGGCNIAADCPPIPGTETVVCIANPLIGCNVASDCPGDQLPCVIPAINPRGVLCTDDAQCVIDVPATQCAPEHTGACCHGTTGVCDNDVLSANCTGEQVVWSKLETCGAWCVRHTGSCCDVSPEADHCTIGYPEACAGPNQTWTKGGECPDPACIVVLGACCNTLAGTCEDNKLAADCSGPQRVFSLDRVCGPNLTCDAVLGACCDGDTFGGCTDVTSAECVPGPNNKLEWTKLASCANIECTHEAIPTVSQWGLVVLTLLLLVGAKVYFGRRQSAAA